MGAGKSSVCNAFNSHGYCGNYLARRRAPVSTARSVLGCHCNARGYAINSRCDIVDFGRTRCRRRSGRFGRSPWQPSSPEIFLSSRLRYFAGAFVRRISYGEKRLQLCEHHARHHRVHSPVGTPSGSLRSTASEVSVGIVVALAAVWPEHQPGSSKQVVE
jgi:hypothetical protein